MKNLKTHILERLKISPNTNAQFDEELEFFLDAFGFNDGTCKKLTNITDDDLEDLKKEISEWFSEYVVEGVNYYTTSSKQTLRDFVSDEIINRIIEDNKDFCGECDTAYDSREIFCIDNSDHDFYSLTVYTIPSMKGLLINIDNPMYATVDIYLEGF